MKQMEEKKQLRNSQPIELRFVVAVAFVIVVVIVIEVVVIVVVANVVIVVVAFVVFVLIRHLSLSHQQLPQNSSTKFEFVTNRKSRKENERQTERKRGTEREKEMDCRRRETVAK